MRTITLCMVLGAFSCLTNCARGEDIPEGKIYSYKEEDGVTREMEIHFPKGHDATTESVPGIIMFHGGGWGGGKRDQFRYLCHYFADRGLVAATVSYRLATKADNGKGSRKRVCIRDAKSAIRWYKQNAENLGIDVHRIIAGGGSAGGHVSLLATTNPELNDPHDNREHDTSVVAYLLFNPALGMADAKDSEVDFLQHIRPDFPPAIVFFGSEDEKWLKGWNAAYTKMQSLDIRSVEFWIAEDQEHSFFNKQPWQDMTIRASDEFLKDLGLINGEPTLVPPKTQGKLVKKTS
ncbi:MAG: alpha/beta hydrolase [Pirellulales bacterium]